jgi:hypothetical protein
VVRSKQSPVGLADSSCNLGVGADILVIVCSAMQDHISVGVWASMLPFLDISQRVADGLSTGSTRGQIQTVTRRPGR